MATYYIKPNGLSQGDLVNFLKDIETMMGGTNTTDKIVTTTTPIAYNTLAAATIIASVITAGSTMASGLSVAVSTGYTGGIMSLFSLMNSRLTSHSI